MLNIFKVNNKDDRMMSGAFVVKAIRYVIFFHQMIALQIWKMLFISSKKLFHSWNIESFVFPSSPLFLPLGCCFRGWLKINFKVYDVINCLNKNLTHFAWYLQKEKIYDIEILFIDRVLNKERFYRKFMQETCTKR